MDGHKIKIKKLVYVLRPLLSAKWCLEKAGIAPMTIGPLMTLLPANIHPYVTELIELKATKPEGFIIRLTMDLRAYIDTEMAACSEASKLLSVDDFDPEALDEFFHRTIMKYDHP